MGVLYFLHKETSRRTVIFCSSRSCCLSVLCFVAKRGFLYGFCSDLMCHDVDSRSNKHCCQLCANPPPFPLPLLSLCCTVLSLDWWTEFLARNSFATIVLRILWNSSREFSAIVPRILRNSTFQNLEAVPYSAVTAFFLQLDIDGGIFFPLDCNLLQQMSQQL